MSYTEYVLVSGGYINPIFLSKYLKNRIMRSITDRNNIRIMAIDKGIEVLNKLDIPPDYIIGDFDSVDKAIYYEYTSRYGDIDIITYSSEKDYTDTELGIRAALDKKVDKITIFGATGTRLDHTLANVRILKLALDSGVEAQIIDEHNKIYLGKETTEIYKNNTYGKYISIMPYMGDLKSVSLKGFKYELRNAIMSYDTSMGVSNEIISDKASITCENGIYIIIESKD